MEITKYLEKKIGFLFLLPALTIICAFIFFPVGYNIWLSFRNLKISSPVSSFIGMANYIKTLTDQEFWLSLKTTIVWVLGSISLQLILGLGITLLINKVFKSGAFFRATLLLSWTIPSLVCCLIWVWMINDIYGIINFVLLSIGIVDSSINFLGSVANALPTVIFINVWRGFPFFMLMTSAGLHSIPKKEYEAAEIDGASSFQQFWYVTLPHLIPFIAVTVILRMIWTFNFFDVIWITTQGGPLKTTQTLPLLVYLRGLYQLRISEAATISVIMAIILFSITGLTAKILRRERT